MDHARRTRKRQGMTDEVEPQSLFNLTLRGYERNQVEVKMASLQAHVEASEADVRSNRDERARLADELGASEREVAALRDALDDGGDSGADVGLVEPQDSSADSTPPSLDDMGHHITEILRTAREQAAEIREAATQEAREILDRARSDAYRTRTDAETGAEECRRAADEEATALRRGLGNLAEEGSEIVERLRGLAAHLHDVIATQTDESETVVAPPSRGRDDEAP